MTDAPAPTPEATPESAPAPSPAPVPAPSPEDWKASLPEDIRDHSALQDIKDVPSLAKSMIHAQKLVGMDKSQMVTVPGEDADEGVLNEFYTKLGRPSTADDYKLPEVDFGEGLGRDEEMEKWYKSASHKYGLSNKQMAGIYQEFIKFSGDRYNLSNAGLEQMKENVLAELKKEWGVTFDTRFKQAVEPLRQFADEDFVELLNTTGLGSHPSMIKFLYKLYSAMGEDSMSDPSKSENLMSPREASAEIAKKFTDKSFMEAYRNGNHPSHKWAVEEMSKLYRFTTAGA